jgi:hypothetical protein
MTLGNSRVGRRYPHGVVNHNQDEHVNHGIVGAIHTNTIKGFWSIIKRCEYRHFWNGFTRAKRFFKRF